MKRLHHILYIFLCVAALAACTHKETIGQDDVGKEEERYNDLAVFDLKGPVKGVATRTVISEGAYNLPADMGFGFGMDNHSFNFQENGLWRKSNAAMAIYGTTYPFSVNRKAGGDIRTLSGNMNWPKITITFYWKGGKVVGMKYKYDGDAEGAVESNTKYIYEDGKVVAMNYQSWDCEGECAHIDCVASVVDAVYDRHGNWTKRTLRVKGSQDYEDYDPDSERSFKRVEPVNAKLVQTRDISYW